MVSRTADPAPSARDSAGFSASHCWRGWFLTVAAGLLSLLGFCITYAFAIHSDSVTSAVLMFLGALFVILFFTQAVREARRRRIEGHLHAPVFAIVSLWLSASGRLIEAAIRALGVENTRSRDIVSLGLGHRVEVVDLTILMVSAVPILLRGAAYAIPRQVLRMHPAKLWVATAFVGLRSLAVTAQSVVRWGLAAGPLARVRDLLGHSTIKMTERYAHLAPENVRLAVGLLEAESRLSHVDESAPRESLDAVA